jgi:hypothetical protein
MRRSVRAEQAQRVSIVPRAPYTFVFAGCWRAVCAAGALESAAFIQ